ncbi:MAG: VOC family protein [Proteobacteria bacterium]|nr:VOC family protein [Pseudomonadota bacterium]
MPLTEFHHCSIRTAKLKETRDFFVDILGMDDGDRPPFDFPGHWLYVGENPVVHLIGIDPDDPEGLVDYLGDQDVGSLGGSGAVDHIAFNSTDPAALIALLKENNVPFRQRKVPDMDLFQIFLEDPNGVTLEINYFGEG